MDRAWAENKLEDYLAVCEKLSGHQDVHPGDYWCDTCSSINAAAELQIGIVEEIVRAAQPRFAGELMPPSRSVGNETESTVRRALGMIREGDEARAKLAPEAPLLSADQLSDRVWRAALPTWIPGHYHVAVDQAAIALNTKVKAASASSLNNRKLVQQVFSPELPRSGQVRFHFDGEREDETWKSRQEGLHHLAQGAFAGIRNIAAHEGEDWSEHEALELLAVLSVVDRWFDETHRVESS